MRNQSAAELIARLKRAYPLYDERIYLPLSEAMVLNIISEAEVIECSQIVRALCELQERRTAMLAVAPQEVK
ncbi:hypothetical protein QTO71_14675 [Klebsiella michiganensis]|nr:hypothetical protein [Klebsiella michiganensis]